MAQRGLAADARGDALLQLLRAACGEDDAACEDETRSLQRLGDGRALARPPQPQRSLLWPAAASQRLRDAVRLAFREIARANADKRAHERALAKLSAIEAFERDDSSHSPLPAPQVASAPQSLAPPRHSLLTTSRRRRRRRWNRGAATS
mmetsp:Transcript_3021/g.9172  ORF Transcript_3021/g.9172 Transcript_3021/m.9172 type:complete len:149 (-) Transcript_3021:767-1213(-)